MAGWAVRRRCAFRWAMLPLCWPQQAVAPAAACYPCLRFSPPCLPSNHHRHHHHNQDHPLPRLPPDAGPLVWPFPHQRRHAAGPRVLFHHRLRPHPPLHQRSARAIHANRRWVGGWVADADMRPAVGDWRGSPLATGGGGRAEPCVRPLLRRQPRPPRSRHLGQRAHPHRGAGPPQVGLTAHRPGREWGPAFDRRLTGGRGSPVLGGRSVVGAAACVPVPASPPTRPPPRCSSAPAPQFMQAGGASTLKLRWRPPTQARTPAHAAAVRACGSVLIPVLVMRSMPAREQSACCAAAPAPTPRRPPPAPALLPPLPVQYKWSPMPLFTV